MNSKNNLNDNSSRTKGFYASLAKYYSDFLSNDFKKSRLPKRRYSLKDAKGKRVGTNLKQFSLFCQKINDTLKTKNLISSDIELKTINISKGRFVSHLNSITVKAIKAEINNLKIDDFEIFYNDVILKKLTENSNEKQDLVLFKETLIELIGLGLKRNIISILLERLQPSFEKSSNNPIDKLIEIEDEVTQNLLSAFDEESSVAITNLIIEKKDLDIKALINEHFSIDVIRKKLKLYFETFFVEDLYDNLREMIANSELIDKVEFYLNLGEASYKNNKFPILFIPLEIIRNKDSISLSLNNILYVNKKAIDYISQDIMRKSDRSVPSYVKDRVIYLDEGDSIITKGNAIIPKILDSFDLSGTLNFGNQINPELKNQNVRVSNSVSISLFDKSDESMMNDYEALLTGLEGGGLLKNFFESLVKDFLFTNPNDIVEQIDDNWDALSVSKKLVFNSPIPLAEEQRKILEAVKDENAKYIAVQGPPGTGKSHTITAIAFNAILEEKSLLILSDTKEALDVVENKLNETLEKVRVDENFQNPILRLGKTGSNYAQLMKPATIEKIKISYNSAKSEQEKLQNDLEKETKELEKNIKNEIKEIDNFPGDDLSKYNKLTESLYEKYNSENNIDIENISNIIESDDIYYFDTLKYFFSGFKKNLNFNLDALDKFDDNLEGLSNLYDYIDTILNYDDISFFNEFPKLSPSKISKISKTLLELENARGIFGYLFASSAVTSATDIIHSISGKKIINIQNQIPYLKNLLLVANNFFNTLKKKKYNKDQINLIGEYSFINLIKLNNNEKGAIKILRDKKINKFFKKPLKNIKYLFSFIDANSKLEELTHDIIEINDLKTKLVGYFSKIPESNFLRKKNKIEEFNTAKLAHIIDKRLMKFHQNNKSTAKTLGKIIRKKAKFPTDSFPMLKTAFPCIIAGLRDYADYIPLQENLFDIIVIDEASQVSIAQALPAIMRSSKMIVLGDRQQFSNVKTSTASKDINNSYSKNIKEDFNNEFPDAGGEALERINVFNVTSSVMDFFEMISNFNIMLRKHFRSYPEMISFSSKYFYSNNLQPMKILNKPISDVISFKEIKMDKLDVTENTNSYECEYIISQLEELILKDDPPSVAVITPFTNQQQFISSQIYNHPKIDDFKEKLKIRIFTFDTCQGEERDTIFYSMVASVDQDKLMYIFPKSIQSEFADEDEIERNKKLQRLNVGFSRAKEKIVFVLSKPLFDFKGSIGEALRHFHTVFEKSKELPTEKDTDQKSKMEAKLLNWIKQTSIIHELGDTCRLSTQFKIGDYLKTIDPNYTNPRYEVDFLLKVKSLTRDEYHNIIIEYDGLREHFTNLDEVDSSNFEYYLREEDVERQKVLESYGYHMIRVNKFNLGSDEVETIDSRIRKLIKQLENKVTNSFLDNLKKKSKIAEDGLTDGSVKQCNKCGEYLNKEEYFRDEKLKSKYGIVCKNCKVPRKPFYGKSYRGNRYRRRY